MAIIDVIIPAINEENAIHLVIQEIPSQLVREIIVCNNGSTDQTESQARSAGATVVNEPVKGYGRACLCGINYLKTKMRPPDIVVFLDGDHSDFPERMKEMVDPIIYQNKDLVIGSRALGKQESGSMTLPQRFGNSLATFLIKKIYGTVFTDLGPYRAIKFDALIRMDMQDQTFGWTVEMQVKAAKMKLNCTEVPVDYRKRIGVSKVSGTIKGTILAGYKILWTIFKLI